jgi:cellulose synthase/poly-beta-1,6-N-acetylglucosamine synthase-like glycosyltransferase
MVTPMGAHAGPVEPVVVSVVIPCRNEVLTIGAVLADLDRQTLRRPFEVIVADGLSGDGTRELLGQLAQSAPFRYRLVVLDNPKRTIPAALNLAIGAARGEFIVRVDAHSQVQAEYVEAIVDALSSRLGDVVGPQVVNVAASRTATAKTVAAMLNTRFGNGGTPSRNRLAAPVKVTHTVMSCYRRGVWERVGGYDEALLANEDFEFDYRAGKAGLTVVSLPRPVFHLIARGTLGALLQQRWRYGVWKARVFGMHPGSLQARQLIPVALLPVALALAVTALPLALALGLLYGAIASVSVAAEPSIRAEAAGSRIHCVLLAPVVGAVTHFAWGAGVWYGLIVRPRGRQ